MGLLHTARERAYVIDRVAFVDDRGREVSGFDANVFRRAFAGRYFSIPRGDLARTIFDAIERKVETVYATSIDAIHEDGSGIDVRFTNGSSRRFDLVVGADGLRSRVRECAFGRAEEFEHYLGYCAASFVEVGYPHRDERIYLSYARPGRQLSRYAMRDERTAFFFVFAEAHPHSVPAHDSRAQKARLHAKFGRDGWECPEILDRLDRADDLYFDAVSQIRMSSWSRGRVALVGDAAYCPSLLAGAGASFAMLGAYLLAGELERADGDHVAAFGAYEGRMRPFIETRQRSAERFARSFAPATAFGVWLRDRMLNLMRFAPLARWYSRHVFASTFDLPHYENTDVSRSCAAASR
jgi:2-polyprenyl-6-methoxyphenol hydroxylase-like FAD-dependent oxidoreductase